MESHFPKLARVSESFAAHVFPFAQRWLICRNEVTSFLFLSLQPASEHFKVQSRVACNTLASLWLSVASSDRRATYSQPGGAGGGGATSTSRHNAPRVLVETLYSWPVRFTLAKRGWAVRLATETFCGSTSELRQPERTRVRSTQTDWSQALRWSSEGKRILCVAQNFPKSDCKTFTLRPQNDWWTCSFGVIDVCLLCKKLFCYLFCWFFVCFFKF